MQADYCRVTSAPRRVPNPIGLVGTEYCDTPDSVCLIKTHFRFERDGSISTFTKRVVSSVSAEVIIAANKAAQEAAMKVQAGGLADLESTEEIEY